MGGAHGRDSASCVVRVAGARASGSGYPNATHTLRVLREHAGFRVIDLGMELPPHLHLWRLRHGGTRRAVGRLLSMVALNGASLVRLLLDLRGQQGLVYVAYPAAFFLWMVSWLPRRWRPRCIADAYISIWDATYRDRRIGDAHGMVSRTVRRFERRALRAAALVLVDTEANRAYLEEELGVPRSRIRSLPLAIDERHFLSIAGRPPAAAGPVRILFVGTLIPLHGVAAVLDAVRALAPDPQFDFRLIGDGQLGGEVEALMAELPAGRVAWIREWCSIERIAEEIGAADICIGVFGGDGKAARVLPFKLYMYLAAGRAIISQRAMSVPAGAPPPPLLAIDPAQRGALASAIRALAVDPARRLALGAKGRAYYTRWLANSRVGEAWMEIVRNELSG